MDDAEKILGIDWGTTNRRAYLLDANGNFVRKHVDSEGILAVRDNFSGSLRALLDLFFMEAGQVILSGMVGSRNGWQEVPYLPADRPLADLPRAMVPLNEVLGDLRCHIVPGYQINNAFGTPDVMRGEETQVFGALLSGAPDGWFLLPGTHSKWVRIEAGTIVNMVTFMTGELFSLLSQHGTLAPLMHEKADAPQAFEAGLRAAQHGGFTHTAFGCRALVVANVMPASHASAYLSGLLIGAELAEIRRHEDIASSESVQIIGAPELSARYVQALDFFDMRSKLWPVDAVYIAALRQLAAV